MLQFEIDIFDLDTTFVHAGSSKLLPLKITLQVVCLFTNKKNEVHGRAYTNAIHLYISDIEITLIVLIRIDASYTLL